MNRFRELIYFERFSNLNSPIHQVNPLIKFIIIISFIISISFFVHIVSYFLLMIPIFGIILFSRISLKHYYFRTLFFITLFAIIIAIPFLCLTPGKTLVLWTIGSVNVIITLEGVILTSSFILRIWVSLQAVMILIFTTPFANLIHAMKHMRIPRIFLLLYSLTYRYIFLFIDELLRMLRAKEARSFRK